MSLSNNCTPLPNQSWSQFLKQDYANEFNKSHTELTNKQKKLILGTTIAFITSIALICLFTPATLIVGSIFVSSITSVSILTMSGITSTFIGLTLCAASVALACLKLAKNDQDIKLLNFKLQQKYEQRYQDELKTQNSPVRPKGYFF